MIKIRKDDRVMKVPNGAYKELYKLNGWTPVEEDPIKEPQEPPKGREDLDLSEHTGEPESGFKEPSSGSEPPSEPPLSEDETLAKMSDTELKQYAALLKINTKKLDRAQLIQAIKDSKE